MTRVRLTARARLTLLFTLLFLGCGTTVVVITYALVADQARSDAQTIHLDHAAEVLTLCQTAVDDPNVNPEVRFKCSAAFREGVVIGADGQREATLSNLLRYSILTLVTVTIVAALAGWLVAGRVLRPVHKIAAAARVASQHDLSARVALRGPRDELRELADTFDEMLARLEASFEGQRRFIANASHELRTPLAVMSASVDVVQAKPAPTVDDYAGMADDVREAVTHAERVIEALLTLARTERGLTHRDPVDLAPIVEDVLDGVTGPVLDADVQPAVVVGDPILLERLVANLVDNAVRYNVPDGQVRVALRGGVLTVENTGPTVPPELAECLFEPFQRSRERRGGDGYGLGLAIVASIAAVHGGTVMAVPRPQGGLTVTVTLPAA